MDSYPDDFSFQYSWKMGSVPPPYYYEYVIKVNPGGTGMIELLPDHPINRPEKRVASLQISPVMMAYLFHEMEAAELFEKPCQIIDSNWVGGSQSSLNVHASGIDFIIPYAISSSDSRRLEPVFLAIQELLPSHLLSGLPG